MKTIVIEEERCCSHQSPLNEGVRQTGMRYCKECQKRIEEFVKADKPGFHEFNFPNGSGGYFKYND